MDLERITCSACGANLSIPDGAPFVNCRHCGASLQVQRTDSVVFTEVREAIQETSNRLDQTTQILRLQGRLTQLDRDWDEQSKSLMMQGKSGDSYVPSKLQSIFVLLAGIGFGSFWLMNVPRVHAPVDISRFGFLIIGAGIAMGIWTYVKAHMYTSSEEEYLQKRAKLVAELRRNGM